MDLIKALEHCRTNPDEQLNKGWISVNDDKEMFWSNERPSIMDGYWGSNTRSYYSIYLGNYTGVEGWRETLRQV